MDYLTQDSIWIRKALDDSYQLMQNGMEPTLLELLSVLDEDLLAEKVI
jgi:hypothetical protein